MMDAMLDVPMSEVVDTIAIDQDTRCGLLGNGGKLQPMYEMMLAQEAGNWYCPHSYERTSGSNSPAQFAFADAQRGRESLRLCPGCPCIGRARSAAEISGRGNLFPMGRVCDVCSAEVRGREQYLCAKRATLWTCTEPVPQRSIREFPAAELPALALRAP
jgi:hypothetical protein